MFHEDYKNGLKLQLIFRLPVDLVSMPILISKSEILGHHISWKDADLMPGKASSQQADGYAHKTTVLIYLLIVLFIMLL